MCQLIAKWESVRKELGVAIGGGLANVEKDSWYRLPGEMQTWNWNVDKMN